MHAAQWIGSTVVMYSWGRSDNNVKRLRHQILKDISNGDDTNGPEVLLIVHDEDTVDASSGNEANRSRNPVVIEDRDGGRLDLNQTMRERLGHKHRTTHHIHRSAFGGSSASARKWGDSKRPTKGSRGRGRGPCQWSCQQSGQSYRKPISEKYNHKIID